MKVFVSTTFEGHYPVGTAAVVVAENETEQGMHRNLGGVGNGFLRCREAARVLSRL